ncbi:MAG TPA: peptidoglycan-binding protein [Acidimicrobiia bacterium]|nr:peptidoglycan-binding protein [Acidimicrobiia bacterium]
MGPTVPLHRPGDSGEAVRDIQDRLAALGFPCEADLQGTYGPATAESVELFQTSRNLRVDGIVDHATWKTLVDAGFRPGDRLLYYRLPMLHGEDVAALQHDLNALGFDAGLIDGVFGADTLRAVLDFQQNRYLPEDGIVGPEFIEELTLMVRATRKAGRDVLRERQWLRTLPAALAGQRVFLDPFCRDDYEAAVAWEAAVAAADLVAERGGRALLSRSADTRPPESLRARQANQLAVDMVLSFSLLGGDVAGIYYFRSSLSHSEAGEAVAGALAPRLGLLPVGRVTPILQETRAPAAVVTVPGLGGRLGRATVAGLDAWLASRPSQEPNSTR